MDQLCTVINSEGKVVYAKPQYAMFKGSESSTAESSSEAEDIASSKALRSYSHLRLTPVREEAKAFGTSGYVGNLSGYDEYVPVVDKAVDCTWNKKVSDQKASTPKGIVTAPSSQKTQGLGAHGSIRGVNEAGGAPSIYRCGKFWCVGSIRGVNEARSGKVSFGIFVICSSLWSARSSSMCRRLRVEGYESLWMNKVDT